MQKLKRISSLRITLQCSKKHQHIADELTELMTELLSGDIQENWQEELFDYVKTHKQQVSLTLDKAISTEKDLVF